MERIDRMMAAAERRRNSALFHIEHHRERFGREPRRALDEVTHRARARLGHVGAGVTGGKSSAAAGS